MQRKLGLTAVLVVALAVAGYAQKPDFSGTWTPEVDPAAAAATPAGWRWWRRRRAWRRRSDDREADRDRSRIERTTGRDQVSAPTSSTGRSRSTR